MSKIFVNTFLVLIPFLSFSQDLEIKHLTEQINTIGSEFNFIQKDKNTAYYSSSTLEDGKYQTLIFKSELKKGEWQKGKYIHLGNAYSYSNISYPKEKNYIYYSVIDKFGNSKIAFRDYKKPVAEILNNNINLSNSTNTQPHKTTYDNKDILYFVSDRKGGFGGLDIWFCIIDKFGNFGEAINAGARINTEYNEITPFFNIWTGELFFSSDRNEKESGIDIFKATGNLNLWNKVERAHELCSSKDDLYLSFYNQYSGYMSSNRSPSVHLDEENCCNDIFSFQYPVPKEETSINIDTIKKNLPISLYFHNDEPNPRSLQTNTNLTYKECYISYYLLKEKYIKINSNIEVEEFFELTLKKNYNNLNSTLKYILQNLKDGNNMELHIKGFASPLSDKDYNINLSKRRIASLINLINNYKNGALKEYLYNGGLKIIELPLGENRSDKRVSDNPNDRKSSVYSKNAMLERKIEIVEILELK
ncbi:MAG: hypothetical protein CMD02_06290 [Flavobacteriales bacterium]|nr:hypothetical protein [Flavobacteriales bacterium]|tara:strand:- start:359 stop:1786 length:1428 start_codon:yes stop_codon:yes gene_type:complete